MAVQSSMMCYQVVKSFELLVNFQNAVNEVVYNKGEMFTTNRVSENVKQLEQDGYIRFKQKLVW